MSVPVLIGVQYGPGGMFVPRCDFCDYTGKAQKSAVGAAGSLRRHRTSFAHRAAVRRAQREGRI